MKKSVDKKIIGFDMDGVIIDHSQNKIMVAKKFGIDLSFQQTPSSIMMEFIEDETYRKIKRIIYDDPDIAFSPPTIEGAFEGLAVVKNTGIPYFLISRRKNPPVAVELLKKRNLWPLYFNETNTFFVLKPEEKNKKAYELGITHYVDDELRVIDALRDVKHRFLFDPFEVLENGDHYTRVSSWPELLKHLHEEGI